MKQVRALSWKSWVSGFTLVEILLVVTLLSILATIGVARYADYTLEARTTVTRERLNQIRSAISGDGRLVTAGRYTQLGFEIHCTGAPTALSQLVTQPTTGNCLSAYSPYTQRGWRGPYLSTTNTSWSTDAWGISLTYTANSTTRVINSCGQNKVCGDSDDLTITF